MAQKTSTVSYAVFGRTAPKWLYRFLKNKLAVVGLIIVGANALAAIFAPFIATQDPYKIDVYMALQGPSYQHLLGTDQLGRDMFSRIIYGTRVSFTVGILSTILAGGVGIALGVAAGWIKGKVDRVLEAIFDIWLSLPALILSIILVSLLGAGIQNTVLAIGLANIPTFGRLIRGEVLRITEKDFIKAQQLLGFSSFKIIIRNVIPNAATPIIVYATFSLALAILAEASLSFLGLGVLPPTPSWGEILNELRVYVLTHIERTYWPGLAIMLLVLGFNFLGDGLRDAFDPKLRV
jgi:ABC-type dipeptide/oligopeptide/nickel transport system permease subunit